MIEARVISDDGDDVTMVIHAKAAIGNGTLWK
jgi:hypothetical protein